MTEYIQEQLFHGKVEKCVEIVRKLFDTEKKFTRLDQVAHSYGDKYLMSENITIVGICSILNCLEGIGVSDSDLRTLLEWSLQENVTLRFESTTRCDFIKEISREEEEKVKHKTEIVGFTIASFTRKKITTVVDYYFAFAVDFRVVAYAGVLDDTNAKRIVVCSRSSSQQIISATKSAPYPSADITTYEVPLDWLLRSITPVTLQVSFRIDRALPSCRTPYRNQDILTAIDWFGMWRQWAQQVSTYFEENIVPVHASKVDKQAKVFCLAKHLMETRKTAPVSYRGNMAMCDHCNLTIQYKDGYNHCEPCGYDLCLKCAVALEILPSSSIEIRDMFIPVAPVVMESFQQSTGVISSDSNMIVAADTRHAALPEFIRGENMGVIVNEHKRNVRMKCIDEIFVSFSRPDSQNCLISSSEASLVAVVKHSVELCCSYSESLQFIENMILSQLVAAIGKTIVAADFTAYMNFHNRKIFRDQFRPVPFCYSVRRSTENCPEGTVRIVECGDESELPIPVSTFSRQLQSIPMTMALNASTTLSFTGERYAHGMLLHGFLKDTPTPSTASNLQLIVNARQFSNFILFIGKITSTTSFEPEFGIIVKNKDEVLIPLLLERIPAPKAFKKAIESLSPEQRQFAKAFRSMQLENTMFGMLVVQIKPQLEAVLNLRPSSLTKEIRLGQDLLDLFINYQISSDLLSYDSRNEVQGLDSSSRRCLRLETVRRNVSAMYHMINEAKEEEIRERLYKSDFVSNETKVDAEELSVGSDSDCSNIVYRLRDEEIEGMCDDCDDGVAFDSFMMDEVGSAPTRGGMHLDLAVPVKSKSVAKDKHEKRSEESKPVVAHKQRPTSIVNVPNSASDQLQVPESSPPDARTSDRTNRECDVDDIDLDNGSHVESTRDQEFNFSKIATQLDENYEKFDVDSALRPTIITAGSSWTRRRQSSLLTGQKSEELGNDGLEKERNAAFDLLDALTKSGALPISNATLHVMIAATHCFDYTLVDTIVKDNVNPIERVERSSLVMAATLSQLPVASIVEKGVATRLAETNPILLSDL